MLGVIERNTVRLRGLIEDILVLNRIEAGGLLAGSTELSVSELVGETVEELSPLADKAAVRLDMDTDLHDHERATVIGDRTQLQRALVNILSNAIKFTPSQGTVRLSCHIDSDTDEVVLTCEDTGIGIPEADLAQLFTRFFRASNATSQAIPGTGLGLAIVQAIVEIHVGTLTVDSVEHQGTTITMRFPRAGAPRLLPATRQVARPLQPPSSQGTRHSGARNRSQARTGTGSRKTSSGAGTPARARRSAPAATPAMARTRARLAPPWGTSGPPAQTTQPVPTRAAAAPMATQ